MQAGTLESKRTFPVPIKDSIFIDKEGVGGRKKALIFDSLDQNLKLVTQYQVKTQNP